MSSSKTIQKTDTKDQSIISEIISGYYSCKSFFEKYTNQDYEIHTHRKKEFLLELCSNFYNKFKDNTDLFNSKINIEQRISRSYFVPIFYKDGGFEFPRSFSMFMDRIKDINTIPYLRPDLSEIEEFLKNIPASFTLEQFFKGFFSRLKRIEIHLRKREVEVLKLISSPSFLRSDENNFPRVSPPDDLDVLKSLGFGYKQRKKVERAINLISRYKLCAIKGLIMNTSKLGFHYSLVETDHNTELPDQLDPFIFWDMDFGVKKSYIICTPNNNTDDLLKDLSYIPLTNWDWNVSMRNISPKKENAWHNFSLPNFLADSLSFEGYNKWDLLSPDDYEFKDWHITTLKELTRVNNVSIYNINELNPSIDKNAITRFLTKMISVGLFQYYPNINFLGIDYRIGFRFSISEVKLFEKLKNGLLSFPICHLFYCKNSNNGIYELMGYIHLPRNQVSNFLDEIKDLKLFHNEFKIHYALNDFNRLLRVLNLQNISFSLHDGFCSLIS